MTKARRTHAGRVATQRSGEPAHAKPRAGLPWRQPWSPLSSILVNHQKRSAEDQLRPVKSAQFALRRRKSDTLNVLADKNLPRSCLDSGIIMTRASRITLPRDGGKPSSFYGTWHLPGTGNAIDGHAQHRYRARCFWTCQALARQARSGFLPGGGPLHFDLHRPSSQSDSTTACVTVSCDQGVAL